MAALQSFFIYLVWPNPGNAYYGSTNIRLLLAVCVLFILLSFVLRFWRRHMQNPVFKKLSRSWPSALFWFGITGLVFVVSRVESIGFLAMRLWWVLWGILLALYIVIQVRFFRMRYYEKLPTEVSSDPRDRYLPKRKK
ncbi:MAG TPA: hypothetical protein DEB30_02785 [Candidatus Peribacter riflensis]|uniref:Uncharacterized protein n=1 Tax=Candidatus Peribacter riflensis TaxID=1735162 RepID=A0A0S1SJ79_9BACT|nr:MAG: hypothetical protein PeribacterA2_0570 [Candidatus Peribacter riflensis]OGJ77099.1 MAG: hypothetical protein A2398_03185 [Candidatus Peribacteria bacterium RIFOXYB1_FULL_57_12]OGJ79034.1 MAG: hypothetical protein A2412_00550 [Candidatus Peribacteria bacterium RIFOXYC1_FULL_58_8]ALM11048.1 MAG: hypothetical protein PeribacterB2_0569 [Candidatus Peribacter riflensis]ALM12151.1 MAG: hypothetical protein PeribacterC2_0569 [Candidatus Peribacter riflensis]